MGREARGGSNPLSRTEKELQEGPAGLPLAEYEMRRRRITPLVVVEATRDLVDDGYCPVADLLRALPRGEHRERRLAVHHAVSQGYLLERRGPDGRVVVALTTEGWRLLRP